MKRGYTLIELLVYTAVFAFLSVVFVNSTLLVTRSFGEFRADRNVSTSASFILERMTREIRGASSVLLVGSTFDASPGALALSVGTSTLSTIRMSLSGGRILLEKENTFFGNLSPENIEVTHLLFRLSTLDGVETVRIELRARDSRDTTSEKIFYTSAFVRQSE